jgi:hypothetical protein
VLWPARANGGDKASPVAHLCVPHQLLGLLNRFPVVFADKDLSRPCKAAGIQWVNAVFGHHSPDAAIAASTAETGTTLVPLYHGRGLGNSAPSTRLTFPAATRLAPAAVRCRVRLPQMFKAPISRLNN